MADTRVQVEVEGWVRKQLEKEYGEVFIKKQVELKWGGWFEADAWSRSGIVACISTSRYKTSGGKPGSGKVNKLYKDLLFMLNMRGVKEIYFVVTERDMYEYLCRRREEGRFPPETEVRLKFMDLPDALRYDLELARQEASIETSPKKES